MAGSGFRLAVNSVADALRDSILSMDQPVRDACTAAIVTAGSNTIILGAANITAKLKGQKLAKSWTARYFPGNVKGRPAKASIDAAVWCYSRIPFLELFEDGGQITGKPLLWIPLRNAPQTIGKGITRGHLTPAKVRAAGVKLFSIQRAGKPPLLAAQINAGAAFSRGLRNVNLSKLKKSKGPAKVTVPLFFGVARVTIRKKLDLKGIAQIQRDALPTYYVNNLKVA